MRYYRQRRHRAELIPFGGENHTEQQIESARASTERLEMAVSHLTAFVLIFYGLYAFCRYGLGYDPVRDPYPPSYTIEIPGLTNLQTHSQLERVGMEPP